MKKSSHRDKSLDQVRIYRQYGRISEPTSDMNELGDILRGRGDKDG